MEATRPISKIQSDLNRARAQYNSAFSSTLFEGKTLDDLAKRYLSHIDKYEKELEIALDVAAKKTEVNQPEIL